MSIILIYIIFIILFYIKDYESIYYQILNIIHNKERNDKNVENVIIKNNPLKKRKRKRKRKNKDIENNPKSVDKSNSSILKNKKDNDINNDIIKKYDYTIKYIDYEINILPYKEAVEKDKRTFLQFFISLIKRSHLLVFTFYPNKDYNSRIIKLCLFLFSFALYYTINTLFFNDSTMHQIYTDEGILILFIYYLK